MRSVAFITLGCKVNQYETQVMREALEQRGYRVILPGEVADVYVINTCTVTGVSDRKSRQMIRRAAALNPDAAIVVTGCYAERSPGEIRDMPGVDVVLSNREKPFIAEYLSHLEGRISLNPPLEDGGFSHPPLTTFDGQTRALVKIQDGCDSFCSYCIVPHVRGGKIISRPLDAIVEEVQSLVEGGHPEVVLTGVHLGAYGRNITDGTTRIAA